MPSLKVPHNAFLRGSIIIIVTAVGYLWLTQRGPLPVYRGTTRLSLVVPMWYMLSAFPVLAILVADWATLLLQRQHWLYIGDLSLQLALLVGISSVRLEQHTPISGHILLFSYFLARRTLFNRSSHAMTRLENGLGLALFAATSYLKLVIWVDVLSWGIGILVGIGLACVSWGITQKVISILR